MRRRETEDSVGNGFRTGEVQNLLFRLIILAYR